MLLQKSKNLVYGMLLVCITLNSLLTTVLSQGQLEITSHPRSQTVKIGEDLTLVCKFSSKPPAPCIWAVNKESFYPDGQHISYVGNANVGDCSIIIRSVNITDDGTYFCESPKVAEDDAVRSSKAIITVLYEPKPPEIWYKGHSIYNGGGIEISVGTKSIEVQCRVKDGNPGSEIIWTLNNSTHLPAATHVLPSTIDKLKLTISTLNLTVADHLKNKQLHCTAKHATYPSGQKEAYVMLNVPGPVMNIQAYIPGVDPGDALIVGPGVTITMFCDADGYPTPLYTWEFRPNSDYNWEFHSTSQNITIEEKAGDYSCLAGNALNDNGNVRSNHMKIQIQYPDDVNMGAIVGGILTVIVVVAIFLGIAIFAYVKRKWCFKPRKIKVPTDLPDGSSHYQIQQHKNIYNPNNGNKKVFAAPMISAPVRSVTQLAPSPKVVREEESSSGDETRTSLMTGQVRGSVHSSSTGSI